MKLGDGRFDAVIIGGGVYGILLALEGSARGHKVLLVERDDFGSGATFNHLRTIHGGLRYLQSLNVRRAVTSNRQRRWWLHNFPDLVEPVACLMPLYNQGMKRPASFRAAFGMARLLGLDRDCQENGRFRVISNEETLALAPHCRSGGLTGGALWQDAFMTRPHRLVAELLHWAEATGSVVCNGTEFLSASRDRDDRWRIRVKHRRSAETLDVSARWIINATGSATDDVVRRITGQARAAVVVPTLAWGVLIKLAPVAQCTVAAAAPGKGRSIYFVHRYHGHVLAGTGHAGIPPGNHSSPQVTEDQVRQMLVELDESLPGAGFAGASVQHVFQGVLPGVECGSAALRKKPLIVDHGARDAAPGAWTVSGVKFTEAPFVARQFWNRCDGPRSRILPGRPPPVPVPSITEARAMSDPELKNALQQIAHAEWHADTDDLVWRRTDLWMDETQARRVSALLTH